MVCRPVSTYHWPIDIHDATSVSRYVSSSFCNFVWIRSPGFAMHRTRMPSAEPNHLRAIGIVWSPIWKDCESRCAYCDNACSYWMGHDGLCSCSKTEHKQHPDSRRRWSSLNRLAVYCPTYEDVIAICYQCAECLGPVLPGKRCRTC